MDQDRIKQLWTKYKPYTIISASFFAAIMIIAIIMDAWILPALIHSGDSVKVPHLIGKSLESAKVLVDNADLDIEKISEQYSESIPAGVVINQIPKPGLLVKEGRNVYLTVSKGMETVKMPFLIGQSIWTARRTLQGVGLTMGDISYAPSELYGRDTIIIQSINANQDVVYGQAINVVVSRGSDQLVSMPNLVGASYHDAAQLLLESGLTVSAIDSVSHETFMPNTIINQVPAAGEMVSKSIGVSITVSK